MILDDPCALSGAESRLLRQCRERGVEAELLDDLDVFRSQQPGISPNRSDTIRSLLRWALEHYPKKTPVRKLDE